MGKIELRVQVDEDLLDQAKAADIALTPTIEDALRAKLAAEGSEERARRWAIENAEAIEAHNRYVEQFGAFGREWRTW